MSKSRKRKPSAQPGSSTPAPAQPEQAALHQPIKPTQAQQSPLRARIDRTLPPFSVQRYVAIWALGMIPLLGLLLILLRPWDPRPLPAKSAPTSATSTGTGSSSQGTPAISATGIGTVRPPSLPALSTISITPPTAPASAPQSLAPVATPTEVSQYLVIETAKGRIVAKLHTSPGANVVRTVANFAERINSGALDGSAFFRVESWFIQGGGDPDATSRLPAEYNKVPFTAGSVALAHGVDPAFNSDSQFLIAKTDAPQLNDQYTNLGQVIQGMDIVNKIAYGDKITKVRVVSEPQ